MRQVNQKCKNSFFTISLPFDSIRQKIRLTSNKTNCPSSRYRFICFIADNTHFSRTRSNRFATNWLLRTFLIKIPMFRIRGNIFFCIIGKIKQRQKKNRERRELSKPPLNQSVIFRYLFDFVMLYFLDKHR